MDIDSVFVLGYTGETGKALIKELDQNSTVKKVVLIGRREVDLAVNNKERFEQKIVNFDEIDKHEEAFRGCQVGFCCLGTTKKKSGKEQFVVIDRDYVVNSAKVAKAAGCRHFQMVSSNGANHSSSFLYMRTKGETEELLKGINFERLSIFRPAFLLVNRVESRSGESIIQVVFKPITWLFPTYASIPVPLLAQAMLKTALTPSSEALVTFENKAIHDIMKNKEVK